MEIILKNKCCLYVIISIRFFSITICNLLNRPRIMGLLVPVNQLTLLCGQSL